MRIALPFLAVLLVLSLFRSPGSAQHPRIAGYERFFASAEPNAEAGSLLWNELHCQGCHAVEAGREGRLPPKQPPRLDQVGSRVRPEFLRRFLDNPRAAKPGTTMPDLLSHLAAADRKTTVEALTHFLASTGELSEAGAIAMSVKQGDSLYHSLGCVACHDPQGAAGAEFATSVPFPELAAKYTVPSLTQFLVDPLAVRPSGRMPHFSLSPDQARNLASFLLRDLRIAPNLKYEYFEGSWSELPDFSKLNPRARGEASGFDVNVGQADHFAVRFSGTFRLPVEGEYTFYVGSDDGSRLLVDGKAVVVNDGVHPLTFESAKLKLPAGVHEIVVEYFEGGGEQELRVEIEGPQLARQTLEYLLTPAAGSNVQVPERFRPNPELVALGKQVFETVGCANCHSLAGTTSRFAPANPALPLGRLAATGGCLETRIAAGRADYRLTDRQRAALQAAIPALRAGDERSPAERVSATMLALNCYGCHRRDNLGGVEDARQAHFKSDQPEMGDEGRLPPPLTGVGAKLRAEWLSHLFREGARDRPYMSARMPRFGDTNLVGIVEALGAADPVPATVAWNVPNERRAKAAGRQLAGAQGLSCIKCHTWGDVKTTGIQAISMTTMARRLRREWFHEYLLNPTRFRPGTRMPATWPDGQALLPMVLDGDTHHQIQAVWLYLSDGDRAAIPTGLGREPIELVASTTPVIYRNFIEGAGPRAIGVGYPERINLAFDAQDLRLALAWQGAFIDASKHWIDRGAGFQPPLGDNVLHLPQGVAFASLKDAEAAWPTASARDLGYRFLGYSLDPQRRPTFRYSIQGVTVEDRPTPAVADGHVQLRRAIVMHQVGPASSLWFRAAAGRQIDARREGWFQVDGDWQVRLTGITNAPMIRGNEGQQELLVQIPSSASPLTLVQEIRW